MHVWLPEAHPARPSHVSALMSGAMVNAGIYGLCRTFEFLGPVQSWQGPLLLALGLCTALYGVLAALVQKNLKRLLALSTVENMGIAAIGLGAGLTGLSCDCPKMAILGFAGALLHVLNHSLFKGLLFLAAGAVLKTTGTASLNALGGVVKKMPCTAALFAVGAAAISGLPPFNGFIGEFALYLSLASGFEEPDCCCRFWESYPLPAWRPWAGWCWPALPVPTAWSLAAHPAARLLPTFPTPATPDRACFCPCSHWLCSVFWAACARHCCSHWPFQRFRGLPALFRNWLPRLLKVLPA